MEPILLEPAYQNYVWGGHRIPTYFNRSLPDGKYAESWEVSDREEGMSVIGNGPKKGMRLKDFLQGKKFPLLIKIIDAKENLSVQIHPDEEAALRLGAEAKTEMWIALEKSTVYAGLNDGVTENDFLEALKRNSVEQLLRKFVLEKGEAIFIPAGVVHAICGDSLLLEVQQNSNTTYRLYDWGRGRELHLEKGLSCVHWGNQAPRIIPSATQNIVANSFFYVERWNGANALRLAGCAIVFCAQGQADHGDTSIHAGQTWLIPEASEITLKGDCELIIVRLS
ncbi:MAG TPA: type I phosphomannose isomerase catalytic subunit [Chlamydiales bacterium]|nr:type I phosphomannose isomerase catalytic subunit [Chlamydiales bacterium]